MKLRWAPRAREDRQDHISYIEEQSLAAALAVDDRIDGAISRLVRHPYSGRPGRAPGTRELVILRTSYIAIYQVDADGIFILRLIHGAQDWPESEP